MNRGLGRGFLKEGIGRGRRHSSPDSPDTRFRGDSPDLPNLGSRSRFGAQSPLVRCRSQWDTHSDSPPLDFGDAYVGIKREEPNPIRPNPISLVTPPILPGGVRGRKPSRPATIKNEAPFETQGSSGKDIPLLTNYFTVLKNPDWGLHQYAVDFDPPEDATFVRKAIVRSNSEFIRHRYIFDGGVLHTPQRLDNEDDTGKAKFNGVRKDGSSIIVTFKYIKLCVFGDPIYLQFYNLILRKCMMRLGLEEIGRGHYNPKTPISYPALNVQLWPGYMTAINQHESDILLCVEITHKVLRTESVLESFATAIKNYRQPDYVDHINQSYRDSIVITTYNNQTYRVLEIKFDVNPTHTFLTKKNNDQERISFVDYYAKKYKKTITDLKQPLIIALPTKRQAFKNKGAAGGLPDADEYVTLIPEFCCFTGLSDAMRANNSLMKQLGTHLHMGPIERIDAIQEFMRKLITNHEVVEELTSWGLHFETDLLQCTGRVLQKEMIHFQTGIEIPNDQEDWTKGFRSQKLHVPESVTDWIIFVTVKDAAKVDNLVRTMQKVAGPLGVVIKTPKIIQIENPKSQTYIKAIDEHVAPKIGQLKLVFVVLATNNATVYAAIKKRLTVDFGVNSQCFLAKNLLSKGIMSISTKVVIQMSAKLGGEPWFVKIPIKGMMVVGFETYKKINAVVATMNQCFTQYFSTVTSTKGKLSVGQISSDIEKCLNAYQESNKELPKYIVVYRAGSMSHDGGFEDVEVQEIKSVIQQYFSQNDVEVPKLTYIIVSKRVNTRLFTNEPCGRDNPPPGTILDNTINVKGRYQFFLVSATARQGTVAPCLYTVIQDDGSIKADKLQILTYKLCHLYFNWSGTVALPAPVQYAHKLAQMTALSYDGLPSHHNLANSLFYL